MVVRLKDRRPKAADWVPVRRGRIYCAPACGGKCTWAAHQLAHRRARALARRLGEGWTPEVHENLGWHYKVRSPCGRLIVHDRRTDVARYSAGLCDKGDVGMHYSAYGDTPQQAVAEVIRVAKADLARIGARLVGL